MIDEQTFGALVFIVSLAIMIYLLHIKKENELENLATSPEVKDVALFNKFLVLGVYLIFLFVSYKSFKESHNDIDGLALIASIIAVIPPAIMIYAFYLAQNDGTTMHPLL